MVYLLHGCNVREVGDVPGVVAAGRLHIGCAARGAVSWSRVSGGQAKIGHAHAEMKAHGSSMVEGVNGNGWKRVWTEAHRRQHVLEAGTEANTGANLRVHLLRNTLGCHCCSCATGLSACHLQREPLVLHAAWGCRPRTAGRQ